MQNLTSCGDGEEVAGLATTLYYIPKDHMGTFTKPPKSSKII